MDELSRRDFLKLIRAGLLALSGALTLGGLLRFLGYDSQPAPQTEFDLGLASDFPLGSQTLIETPPALLRHTPDGFSALSLTCTHLGCSVEPSAQGFSCPCHGSRFDASGGVVHGPATQNLPALRVEQNAEGRLILYLG